MPSAKAAPLPGPRFSVQAGTLSADQGGRWTTIADGVEWFWPVAIKEQDGGDVTAVTYSKADGAGGYEGEGQALYLWIPGYAEGRKLVSEYFQIQRVEPLVSRSGRTVLKIVMKDGGLGATHVAFAAPDRGELHRADGADVVDYSDGAVQIGWFRDEDWLDQDAAIRPMRTERIDIDALLTRPTMQNPRRP